MRMGAGILGSLLLLVLQRFAPTSGQAALTVLSFTMSGQAWFGLTFREPRAEVWNMVYFALNIGMYADSWVFDVFCITRLTLFWLVVAMVLFAPQLNPLMSLWGGFGIVAYHFASCWRDLDWRNNGRYPIVSDLLRLFRFAMMMLCAMLALGDPLLPAFVRDMFAPSLWLLCVTCFSFGVQGMFYLVRCVLLA